MDRTIVNKVHQLFAVFLTSILSLFSLFSSNSIKINQKSYKIISQIGEGGFSYVFLVSDPSTGAKFALKRVRIQLPEHLTRVQAEIKAHSLVDNRHVIKLVDSWVGKTNNLEEGLLLLPFYKNGTLQNLIDQPGHITLARIIAISFDILSGLKAFHAKDLAYRDLKPHNIIFNDSDSAIIMDLGSVTRASIAINSRKDALAVSELCAETATELFDPPVPCTLNTTSDIWSFGCVVFNMAYKSTPFDGSFTSTVGARVPFPANCVYGQQFQNIIKSILVSDFTVRPNVDQVIVMFEKLRK